MIRIAVVAAANTVLVVVLVAAIALGVTLTVAGDSFRRLSLAHAETLVDATLFALSRSFDRTAVQAQTWGNNTRQFLPTTVPSNDPLLMQRLTDQTLMAFLATGDDAVSAGIVWYDLSRVVSFYWGEPKIYGAEAVWPDDRCPPAVWCHAVHLWNSSSNVVFPYTTNQSQLGMTTSRVTIASGFQQISYNTGGGRNTFWTSPLIYGTTDSTFYSVGVISPLRTANHTPVGFGIISQSIQGMSAIVKQHTASGGAGFVVDVFGYLLASSLPPPFVNITQVPSSVDVNHAVGCDSLNYGVYGLSSVAAVPSGNKISACRSHVTKYAYDALNILAEQNINFIFATTRASTYFKVGSGPTADGYFGVAEQIVNRFPNLNMYLLVIVPEEEVTGDVQSGTNLSIGLTVGFMVLMIVACTAVMTVVLTPLRDVANRLVAESPIPKSDAMRTISDAGRSGGSDEALPNFSELIPLVVAYRAMQAELGRIRAYIPRAALESGDNGDASTGGAVLSIGDSFTLGPGLEAVIDDASTTTPRSARRGRIRRSAFAMSTSTTALRQSRGTPSARFADGGDNSSTQDSFPITPSPRVVTFSPMVRVSGELRPSEVALLSMEVMGYQRVCQLREGAYIAPFAERLAAYVWCHVSEAWGTVHEMHGDSVLCVFATLPRRRRPLSRALRAGLNLLKYAEELSCELPQGADHVGFALGADHGVVLMGPGGCEGATSMHVMGRSVNSTVAMSGLARLYRRQSVLVPLKSVRGIHDLGDATNRVLDAVRLADGNLLHIAECFNSSLDTESPAVSIVPFFATRDHIIRSIGVTSAAALTTVATHPLSTDEPLSFDSSYIGEEAEEEGSLTSTSTPRARWMHDLARLAPHGDVTRVELEAYLINSDVPALRHLMASGRASVLDTRVLMTLVLRLVPRVPLVLHNMNGPAPLFALHQQVDQWTTRGSAASLLRDA